MKPIQIYTIGFTQKTAQAFFSKLRDAGVHRIVDVRLNNTSQLAGFSKRDDLIFFLREIAGIEYVHLPELSPTKDIIDAYKKHKGPWAVYEKEFFKLMRTRRIEDSIAKDIIHQGCLLCSEHKPDHCHRRLVADYLKEHWDGVETKHLI